MLVDKELWEIEKINAVLAIRKTRYLTLKTLHANNKVIIEIMTNQIAEVKESGDQTLVKQKKHVTGKENAGNYQFRPEDVYHFLKVEEYFENYTAWENIGPVISYKFDESLEELALNFKRQDGVECSMLIQFPRVDTFRVRFNPNVAAGSFSDINTRSVIQDNFSDLKKLIEYTYDFKVNVNKGRDKVTVTTQETSSKKKIMGMVVNFSPFKIEVFNESQGSRFKVWESADTPIYFAKNGEDDYSIIQAVNKPANAKYIGFGEQGGMNLSKNTVQLNYFNFDNMRYRQVYNKGPLDPREPLYHTDPIFFEYNGVPDKDSLYAIFVDNPGQILMDIGYLNSNRYMFGTRFGDLDYYFFLGNDSKSVVESYTSIVGRSRLKPRYALGYHQGCYGYERRDIVEWAVQKYRDYQIPIDGLHVDVDIQHNYQTFTIDEGKFPNPGEMFHNLKEKGIKCSTNITPVISREDPNYQTYVQARDNDYFVKDSRYMTEGVNNGQYQLYGGGKEYSPNEGRAIEGFNSGEPYIGGVYYGTDGHNNELGTSGHYSDLARKDVRRWWGTQYQYLYNMGLEMVWQDMTTPAIRDIYGDMKGFPFRLEINSNFMSNTELEKKPAIKVWNLYSYNLHKATYHGLNNLEGRENIRNFIIGRGCYSGSHRFAGLWTGDNSSDWDFLQMNVSQALSLGLCGLNINGQDIGGFEASNKDNGRWASPELLIRWTAAGAFLPWFRNHYVRKGRKEFQEPFMYVEWFEEYGHQIPEPQDLYRMVLPICKHYIELRYRLLQLFYDCLFENTLNGRPICSPLFVCAPEDKALFNDKEQFLNNEFFLGNDMLVAPVLIPQEQNNNQGKRDVYLPSGSNWYCFMNNTAPLGLPVEGGTTIREFDANLNMIDNHINFIVPVYVREGAVIPTMEIEQFVGQRNKMGQANPITLNIYPGNSGSYTMYLDDGISRSSASTDAHPLDFKGDNEAKDEYRKVDIKHGFIADKERELVLNRSHDNYKPLEEFYYVAILHDPNETFGENGHLSTVLIEDKPVELLKYGPAEERAAQLSHSDTNKWYYNENINISFIKVFDNSENIAVSLRYY